MKKHEKKHKPEGHHTGTDAHDGKFIGKAQAVGYDAVEANQEGKKSGSKEPGVC